MDPDLIGEYPVLVTTDLTRLTRAQRADLLDRMWHWLPAVDGRPLRIRMTVRTKGGPETAREKAHSVVARVLADSGIGGAVLDVSPQA